MPYTIVVALGGNAILRPGQKGTAEEQMANVRMTCRSIVRMIQLGHRIVITHGNGPQVGNILIQNSEARHIVPPMPLDYCGAQSQGLIGYMIQQSLYNELVAANIEKSVVTILTQTVVRKDDPAFSNPTKPVGPFYSQQEAQEFMRTKGEKWVNDANRGWRRVVPSPRPERIVEAETIRHLVNDGMIVIASGGGGIPVFQDQDYSLSGIEAVIDKDLAAAKLAIQLHADILLILTDVEMVAINYGTADQSWLKSMTPEEAIGYLEEGHFKPGSMGPKVTAAVEFASHGGRAVITSLEKALEGALGRAGTQVASAESLAGLKS